MPANVVYIGRYSVQWSVLLYTGHHTVHWPVHFTMASVQCIDQCTVYWPVYSVLATVECIGRCTRVLTSIQWSVLLYTGQ